MESFRYFGEFLALLTALVWAIAVILFKKSGEKVRPLALNAFKIVFTMLLIAPTTYLFGQRLDYPAPLGEYVILFLSGALGAGIGDYLFFKGLNKLGASLCSIAGCTYSPIVIGLSMLVLGERFTVLQALGTVSIIGAIVATSGEVRLGNISRRDLVLGILWTLLANLANGVGIVFAKRIIEHSPLFWATEVRLMGGLVATFVLILLHPQKRQLFESLTKTGSWGYTISGTLFGTYFAMVLWLAGMKYAQASTAAVLNQTSEVWVFIFAALLLHERLNARRIIAITVATTGVMLVALGG